MTPTKFTFVGERLVCQVSQSVSTRDTPELYCTCLVEVYIRLRESKASIEPKSAGNPQTEVHYLSATPAGSRDNNVNDRIGNN